MSKSNADSLANFGQAVLDLFIASYLHPNGNTSGADFSDRVGQLAIENELLDKNGKAKKPKVKKPKAKRYLRSPPVAWTNLSFDAQCQYVDRSGVNTVWRNKKTGRIARITSKRYGSVQLLHMSGKSTSIQNHYFAGDYWPVALESK